MQVIESELFVHLVEWGTHITGRGCKINVKNIVDKDWAMLMVFMVENPKMANSGHEVESHVSQQ